MSELSDRALHLLKALVEIYIKEGRPVGSKTLAEESSLSLSSASIRKIMAELEGQGYVVAPHTSAGRVPTAMGYRLFVDGLIAMSPVEQSSLEQMKVMLQPDQGVHQLMESTSELLSEFTQMASLVMVPKREQSILRQLEFLPLSNRRILVILVLNEQEVQNRIIRVDCDYSEAALKQAANYVNQHFAGQPMNQICQLLGEGIQQDKERFDQLFQAVQELVPKALEESNQYSESCLVFGQEKLLGDATSVEMGQLKEVFNAFTQKREILSLMEGCLDAQGVQIFIGEEAGTNMFDGFSLIGAPYEMDSAVVGVLAVFGPTRMPYERVIPTVDITAKILSSALNQSK